MKNKKKKYIVVLLIAVVVILITKRIRYEQSNKIIKTITNHYGNYVITNKNVSIYDSEGKAIGKIAKNIGLALEKIKINETTKYFKLSDLKDAYVKYDDVMPIDNLQKPDRYKKYIPYNQNIVTKNITIFYDDSHKMVYQFNNSFELPIIIKENEYYGIEFNNELLYINKNDVEKVVKHNNTNQSNSSGVAVLNYHAFYDEKNLDEVKKCNTSICISKSQFNDELEYFKKINVLTITMNELEMYIDGKIQLPKSILITIDDGGYTKIAVDLLTKYKMYATIFLITSRFNPQTYYVTDYIELHSHSHNLHNPGVCPGEQGSAIKCLPRKALIEDLKKSRELLNNTTAFCYPFYEYNEYSTNILKEAGFTMAFIGEVKANYGYKLAEVNSDKYHIPRFVIFDYTSITDLKKFINEIK